MTQQLLISMDEMLTESRKAVTSQALCACRLDSHLVT